MTPYSLIISEAYIYRLLCIQNLYMNFNRKEFEDFFLTIWTEWGVRVSFFFTPKNTLNFISK